MTKLTSVASLSVVFFALILCVPAAFGQSVISAQSGLLHYAEGKTLLNNEPVVMSFGKFPDIATGQTFETKSGRGEILLAPGMFLWVGEDTTMKMVSKRLTDSKVELVAGSMMLESAETDKNIAVTLLLGEQQVVVQRKGLYRLDSTPPVLRVYNGEAQVISRGVTTTVKEGRQVALDAPLLVAAKFDRADTDTLYRWAKRRSEYMAIANVSAARKAGTGTSTFAYTSGGWLWNPYYGMLTYMPYRGTYYSPFGYRYWSPSTVGRAVIHEASRPSYSSAYNSAQSNASMNRAPSFTPSYDSSMGYSTADRSSSYNSNTSYSSTSNTSYSTTTTSTPVSSGDAGRGSSAGAGTGGGAGGGRR